MLGVEVSPDVEITQVGKISYFTFRGEFQKFQRFLLRGFTTGVIRVGSGLDPGGIRSDAGGKPSYPGGMR
eukprot:9117062-Pyramimonas_sp.AAC.1